MINALDKGDRILAARLLDEHWVNGIQVVLAWLAEQGVVEEATIGDR